MPLRLDEVLRNPAILVSRSARDRMVAQRADEDGHRTIQAGIAMSEYPGNAFITSKYNWVNMLPKAIFEQFRRLSNFYFLIVAAISFIPNISPATPITTTLPLVVVIGFGLARDVYEDFLRKRADAKANNRPVIIRHRVSTTDNHLRNPRQLNDSKSIDRLREAHLNADEYHIIRSRDLAVGDVLLVLDHMELPADVVVLNSAHSNGECFVSTANLDGESNLKRRVAVPGARNSPLEATVEISAPTAELYQVEGSVSRSNSAVASPLDVRNLLLRGSVLRNTPFVHALVVYTGFDTKLARNMRDPPSKLGGVERMMNRVVIALFLVLLLLTVVTSAVAGVWQTVRGAEQWYMGDNTLLSGRTVGLRSLGTFIILYHTFVPVSLFVTLEFVRLVQGLFISADPKMRTDGEGPDVRANNLNETLGYVDHVFSDKTGTLTQNIMRFAACIVPGASAFDVRDEPAAFRNAVSNSTDAHRLATAIAVAHDIVPAHVEGKADVEYQGESADEVALLDGAREAGILVTRRVENKLFIRNANSSKEEEFDVLAVLEFTSERKRMSVIAKCPDGRTRIFSKGADTTMGPLLVSRADETDAHRASDELSRGGLRTLVYGERLLDEKELSIWLQSYHAAVNAMEGRAEKKIKVANAIEFNLKLLGVTGVEDKLQDDVPDTIVFMREAGIRIWVLTGDKVETAENIGYSSLLLNRSMKITIAKCDTERDLIALLQESDEKMLNGNETVGVVEDDVDEKDKRKQKRNARRKGATKSGRVALDEVSGDHALIIDGNTLSLVESPEMERLFVVAAMRCQTVICARVTPLQKAHVVRMVRKFVHSNTLSIGDGGNDVSMIQEANIGVGIKGKEGAQAARAADYALGEFKHLKRLLAIHGRYSYVRTAGVINLSFYKNVFFSCTQFLFQFFCFASGTTLHNQWIVTFWNALITLFPPFFFGIFERDLDVPTLLRFPSVYSSNRGDRLFSLRTVMEFTVAYSVWHALTVFWLTFWGFGHWRRIVFSSGLDAGFSVVSLGISIMCVSIALSKFLLTSHLWTIWVIAINLLSFAIMWVLILILPSVFHESSLEGVLPKLMSSANYHLLWPVVFVTAFIPDFLVRLRRSGRDNLVERLQIMESRQKRT